MSVIDSTAITATTPAHAAGLVDVAVTTAGGTGVGSGLFTYIPAVPTSTSLVSSLNPSLIGQPVTLKATVTPAGATGTVTFTDGAATLCALVPLVNGAATCVASFATPGAHPLQATYSGSPAFSSSTSAVLTQIVDDQRIKTVEIMTQRNNLLLSNEPDADRQIDRLIAAGRSTAYAPSKEGTMSSGAWNTEVVVGQGPPTNDITLMRLGVYQADHSPPPVLKGAVGFDDDATDRAGAAVTGPLRASGARTGR